jgi:hypothetical protein
MGSIYDKIWEQTSTYSTFGVRCSQAEKPLNKLLTGEDKKQYKEKKKQATTQNEEPPKKKKEYGGACMALTAHWLVYSANLGLGLGDESCLTTKDRPGAFWKWFMPDGKIQPEAVKAVVSDQRSYGFGVGISMIDEYFKPRGLSGEYDMVKGVDRKKQQELICPVQKLANLVKNSNGTEQKYYLLGIERSAPAVGGHALAAIAANPTTTINYYDANLGELLFVDEKHFSDWIDKVLAANNAYKGFNGAIQWCVLKRQPQH